MTASASEPLTGKPHHVVLVHGDGRVELLPVKDEGFPATFLLPKWDEETRLTRMSIFVLSMAETPRDPSRGPPSEQRTAVFVESGEYEPIPEKGAPKKAKLQ